MDAPLLTDLLSSKISFPKVIPIMSRHNILTLRMKGYVFDYELLLRNLGRKIRLVYIPVSPEDGGLKALCCVERY